MPSLVGIVAAAALGGAPVSGQGRVLLQAGGATSLPAADAVSEAALYGVGGLALEWAGDRTLALASLYGGIAADEADGADFGSAALEVEGWWSTGTSVGLTGSASAFRIREPFTWRTHAFRGGPALRVETGRVRTTLVAELGMGATLVEVRRPRGTRRAERDLWSRGVALDLAVTGSTWRSGVDFGAWESDGGDFGRAGVSTAFTGGTWTVQAETGLWHTPLGTEWTGGVALSIPLGSSMRATSTVGRASPDPLILVEAGDQAGALFAWSIASFGGPPPPVATVVQTDQGPAVDFRLDDLDLPAAAAVALIGDFTGWTPAPMHREGDRWTLTLSVPPGLYHYGFQIDGEWFVPDGLPGNVPDDWGRMNATLVVDEDDGGLR
ncbi:glycogen-binding domain-containing protein [Gemmatimonadota bacterium Y43]|uniref:glycogen-binding domain-containing protein n=1 Tax=Gaopeijia maritima TaxID=3119007 RepID=UPI0032929D27